MRKPWDCKHFQLDAAHCSGQLPVLDNRQLYCLQEAFGRETRIRVRIFPWVAERYFQTRERHAVIDSLLQKVKDMVLVSDGTSIEVRVGGHKSHTMPA